MPATLSIDGFDLSSFLRVHPEDGLDPIDSDLVQPGFGDVHGGEGTPLLSINIDNREMVFPVHLSPKATGAYPDTKQGMHDLIRDVNSLLSNAKKLTWQDEGASNSTTFDVIFARFETEYNYRRGQVLYGSGVIRVWAKPYGHTATYRIVGSAQATGLGAAFSIPAGSIAGDVTADAEYIITTGSIPAVDAAAVGVAVVPSGYTWDIPAASITRIASYFAVLATEPLGVGSKSFSLNCDRADMGLGGVFYLSPATMYLGRNRLIAIARGGNSSLPRDVEAAFYYQDERIGAVTPSTINHHGHDTLDIGVLNVNYQPGLATIPVYIRAEKTNSLPAEDAFFNWANGIRINRILVFPDQSFSAVLDAHRSPIVRHTMSNGNASLRATVDDLGNSILNNGTSAILVSSSAIAYFGQGLGPDKRGRLTYEATVVDPAKFRLQVGEGWAGYTTPSYFFSIGKDVVDYHVNAMHINGSRAALWLGSPSAAVVIASQGFDNGESFSLEAIYNGPRVEGLVRSVNGTILATVAGSNANFLGGGRPFWEMARPSGTSDPLVAYFECESMPSLAHEPRDRYVLRSEEQLAARLTSASVFERTVSGVRGEIPRISPTLPQQVVGLRLPMGNAQYSADIVNVSIRVQERFRYAR